MDGRPLPTRDLGGMETGMAIGDARWPLNMVTSMRLGAVPDVDVLRRALDEVQRRHPPLRARIERYRRRRRFVYDVTDPVPLRVAVRHDEDTWQREVEELLNTRLPAGGPPVAATLVRPDGGDRCELMLAFRHAIVDGVSAATLWGELLGAYAALLVGDIEHPPPTPIPPPADALVPDRFRGWRMTVPRLRFAARAVSDEARFRRSTARRSPKVDPAGKTVIHTVGFDVDTSRRIGRAARERRCTVHGLLHAVVLRAVHTTRYGGDPVRMRTIAFTDLRPSLTPRPPEIALSPYIALTSQDVLVASDRSLWDLAGDVQERVRASAGGEAKFISYSMARPLMAVAVGVARLRMGTTAVSHTGPVPIEGADGPLPVEDLHAFVSNLAIGPEISMRTGSFRGRLTLDMMALDTDVGREGLAELAALMVEQLEDVARPV